MPTFYYKALTENGEIVDGSVDAENRDKALSEIRLSGRLPIDASEEGAFSAVAHSNLQQDGSVDVTITKDTIESHSFGVFHPNWAKHMTLSLNGKEITPTTRGQYVWLKRLWKKGDVLKIADGRRDQINGGIHRARRCGAWSAVR